MSISNLKSRRRTPRRKIDAKIGVMIKGKFHVARCVQIGEGGILLQTDMEIETKKQYLVSIIIPLEGMIVGRVEILYKKPYVGTSVYGCQFSNLDFKYKKVIRIYVSQKTEMEGDEEFGDQTPEVTAKA